MTRTATEVTYPVTIGDLSGYPEANTIHTRSYDARWQARQQRVGYSEEAACRLLECSPEELHACERGLLDTTWVGDVPYPLPDIMLPTKAKRLRYAYARFLSATEQLPPRPVPVDRGVRAPHGRARTPGRWSGFVGAATVRRRASRQQPARAPAHVRKPSRPMAST